MTKVKEFTNQSDEHAGWMIICPACKKGHLFDKRWKFNGDMDRPTFTPSMLVYEIKDYQPRCHSFVTDGMIQFLNDCTHDLKGQTVPLEEYIEGNAVI